MATYTKQLPTGTCVICIQDDVKLVPFFCCFQQFPDLAQSGKPHEPCVCMACMYKHGIAAFERNVCPSCPLCAKSLLGEYMMYTGWTAGMWESVVMPHNGFSRDHVKQWRKGSYQLIDVQNTKSYGSGAFATGFALLLLRVALSGVQPGTIQNCPLSQDYAGHLSHQPAVFYTISFNHTVEKYILLTWNGPKHGTSYIYSSISPSFSVRHLPYFSKPNLELRKQRRACTDQAPVAKRTRIQASGSTVRGFTGLTLEEEHHEDKLYRRSLMSIL